MDGEGTGYVEGDNEDGVDTEEEQDHACYHKAQKEHEKLCSLPPLCPSLTIQMNVPQAPVLQNFQPAPAAKRQVGLAFSYCNCVYSSYFKSTRKLKVAMKKTLVSSCQQRGHQGQARRSVGTGKGNKK